MTRRYYVVIEVQKVVRRIVRANSERQAVSKVKKAIASKPLKISSRNFEEYPHVESE